jgi:hypothetical protein
MWSSLLTGNSYSFHQSQQQDLSLSLSLSLSPLVRQMLCSVTESWERHPIFATFYQLEKEVGPTHT